MYTNNLGELQSVLVSAMRCLDCRDPRCVGMCPEKVDVRRAMRFIIARPSSTRRAAWMQNADQATASAMDGIEESFEGC